MDFLVEKKDKVFSEETRTIQEELEFYFDRLFPLNRSLTGYGNRQSFQILSELVQLKIHEVPSGTQCFDWIVPPEWNVREAWIKNSKGEKIVDFESCNLHLMGYSEPFQGKLTMKELIPHLYTLPEHPEAIPYKTSYYQRQWGFCLAHRQFLELKEDLYDVKIDSVFNPEGSMTYGEAFIKGRSEKEILFSTYICHPSLANNELSGPLVTSFIYKKLAGKVLNYSYRFLFVPETIGSIYYLSRFGESLKRNLIAGFVVTTIGDPGPFTYKRSRQGNSLADRATELVLRQTEDEFLIEDFFPFGSDERQFCSPGFNLPVGSLMRTRYGKYWQYHTSEDNKSFISFEAMAKSVDKYIQVIELIEANETLTNKFPFCEPKFSSRGITFPNETDLNSALWLLNLADGNHDLIDISNQSKISYKKLISIAATLKEKGLIQQFKNSDC